MLLWTKGINAPETIEATECAAVLARKSGDLRQLFNLMIARAGSALVAGDDLSAAAALADHALELVLHESSPSILGRVHHVRLMTDYFRGDLANAEKHFTEVLQFFDDPRFRRDSGFLAVVAFALASVNAWVLGRSGVARERMARMMAAANQNKPYELALVAFWDALLQIRMREYEQAEALAAQAVELYEKLQSADGAAVSRCLLGHTRAELGRAAESIALIRQGLTDMREVGKHWSTRMSLGFLAAAQERAGATTDALETVEQALQANPDQLVEEPELLRIRGELRLKLGDAGLAQTDFREAIELARTMNAKSWELRAAMSLARLLAKQGRRDEARTMLAEIYGWFTEGSDTVDLKDAKALLDELAT